MSNRYESTTRAEMRNGQVYVTRLIQGIKFPCTKWDLFSEDECRTAQLSPFNGECSSCKTKLPTEADFAKHYIIPDVRYFNLGDCPNKRLGSYDGETK